MLRLHIRLHIRLRKFKRKALTIGSCKVHT
jgi:hypothetical protein